MTVLKVGFVDIRSDLLDETVALFRDVIGVPVTSLDFHGAKSP